MTRLGLAIAAAAALAALPHAALAQRAAANAPAAAPPGKVDPKAQAALRTRGMKEAPPLVAASGAQCQVTDALYKGEGTEKGADGKPVKVAAYEVACASGPGYIVATRAGQAKPQAVNCIIATGGGTKCELPQNTDFKAALAPSVKQAGRQCDIVNVRYVGSNTGQQNFYELACAPPSLGFIIGVSDAGAAPLVNDCTAALGTSQQCQFTTKAQLAAAYQPDVSKSGKACQVTDFRSIGRSKSTGEEFTEIACSQGVGFVLVRDGAGAYKNAIDCAKAAGIADGCKLTDITVAQTQEAGTYSRLAAKAGFPCDVGQYRVIGTDAQNREVVELQCKNRPDGGVAVFADGPGQSRVYDCVRAAGIGGSSCKLSQVSVVYPKYSDALAAKGRGTCKVSNASYLGRNPAGAEYVEVACADGAPGWVVGFKEGSNAVDDLLTCRQATASGMGCKLPTNIAGNKGS